MGLASWMAGEMAASPRVAAANASAASADMAAIRAIKDLNAAVGLCEHMTDVATYNLALRCKLESVLENYIPQHPVLKDQDLRQRIGKAGQSAYQVTTNWDAVREAGKTFSLPRLPSAFELPEVAEDIRRLQDGIQSLTEQLEELKAANARLSEDLGRQQRGGEALARDCAHHLAQSAAFRAQLEHVDPSNPLIRDPSMRKRVADLAYEALQTTNDWAAVREVGRTFLLNDERRRLQMDVADGGDDEGCMEMPPELAAELDAMTEPAAMVVPGRGVVRR